MICQALEPILNEWNTVKINIKNKIITVHLNENEIYKSSYKNSNGKIKGINFSFAGSGAIDYARLFDANNNLTFSEDFDSINNSSAQLK